MKLQNKTALITGASQGFGLAVAQAYVAEGCSVCLCARSASDLAAAVAALQQSAPAGVKVVARPCDVGNAGQVADLFAYAASALGRLDIVVSNAGIYGPKGPTEDVPLAEFETAVQINLLGTLYVAREAIRHMKAGGGGRQYGKIILLSGGGATKPMPFLSSYAATKAAVVRLGETLAEEVRDFHIDINSVAPGALNTRLLDEVLAAGPDKVGQAFYNASLKQRDTGGAPLEKGAALCVYLASDASNGITGKLISAIWDPWAELPAKLAQWNAPDIYTLRRITPEDRCQKT